VTITKEQIAEFRTWDGCDGPRATAICDLALEALELRALVRDIAARVDGDGGQRQGGETIAETGERIDVAIVELRALVPTGEEIKTMRGAASVLRGFIPVHASGEWLDRVRAWKGRDQ
jgi:hypothetical protein